MPKRAPFGKKKTTPELVNSYGLSISSIRLAEQMTPYLHPLHKVTEGWAKFLLAAESQEEKRWQSQGIPLLEDFYHQKIVLWQPKAVSWQIPGGRYSPDFFYIFEDGMRLHVEVKGNEHQAGYRDAMARMRVAATLRWYDRFLMAVKETTTTWKLKEVLPDKDYQSDLFTIAANIEQMNEEK